MNPTTTATHSMPAEATVMQMVMGAFVTKVISEATRLDVPDVVKRHGPLSAAEMVSIGGIGARQCPATPATRVRQPGCSYRGRRGKIRSHGSL